MCRREALSSSERPIESRSPWRPSALVELQPGVLAHVFGQVGMARRGVTQFMGQRLDGGRPHHVLGIDTNSCGHVDAVFGCPRDFAGGGAQIHIGDENIVPSIRPLSGLLISVELQLQEAAGHVIPSGDSVDDLSCDNGYLIIAQRRRTFVFIELDGVEPDQNRPEWASYQCPPH